MLDTSTSFGPARAADARADVHGDPADVIARTSHSPACSPARTSMPSACHCVANRHRAADRPLWAVEHREEAVARCVHLTPSKAGELRPDDGVVRIEQRVPVTVSHLCGPPCRVHDVGEQHGGENPIIGHVSAGGR